MSVDTATIVRAREAKTFMDGPELCREYMRNGTMWFGSSTLAPGQIGGRDPGHPGCWEVFFCTSGHAVVNDGANSYELFTGDALLIPPSLPHTIHNVGTEMVTIAWAGAPGVAGGDNAS